MSKEETHKNFLKNLARIENDSATKALSEQAMKIGEVLGSSTNYEQIDRNLDLLDIFIFRVPEQGLQIVSDLLNRLPDTEVTFENERYADLADNLTKRAISVLCNLRFMSTSEVLKILTAYMDSDDDEVAQYCVEQLKELAGYNITALKHLGLEPQKMLLAHFVDLPRDFKVSQLSQIASILSALLELTANDTTSDYQSVTWHAAVMTVTDELIQLRSTVIVELAELYENASDFHDRVQILLALKNATSLPRQGNYGQTVERLVEDDSKQVIAFYNEISNQADVTELEEIETQVNFLKFRNGAFDAESNDVQELEAKIASNKDYAFHKVLMGGYDAFAEYWHDREGWSFEKHGALREVQIDEILATVDEGNFDEWSSRIVATKKRASSSSSRQYFVTFLTRLSQSQPEQMLSFLKEQHQELDWFIVPILSGLWSSLLQDQTHELIHSWVSDSQELLAVTNFLAANEVVDLNLAASLLENAAAQSEQDTLSELVALAISQFEHDESFFADLFIATVQQLSGEKVQWPRWARFQKSFPSLVEKLDDSQVDALLSSLEQAEDISYELEEVLQPIASRDPSKIVPFFERRVVIQNEKNKPNRWSSRYDAMPFQFYSLHKELTQHLELVFDQVYVWFEKDVLWAWEASRFIHNVFRDLTGQVEQILLKKITNGNEKDALNVLTVLKEYQGDVQIHNACKEAIRRYPESKAVRSNALIALDATGVVSGQFGFRDAHVRKKEETQLWLDDDDPGIKEFAVYYHAYLDERIERETIDGERDLEVRKKVHGVRQKEA